MWLGTQRQGKGGKEGQTSQQLKAKSGRLDRRLLGAQTSGCWRHSYCEAHLLPANKLLLSSKSKQLVQGKSYSPGVFPLYVCARVVELCPIAVVVANFRQGIHPFLLLHGVARLAVEHPVLLDHLKHLKADLHGLGMDQRRISFSKKSNMVQPQVS